MDLISFLLKFLSMLKIFPIIQKNSERPLQNKESTNLKNTSLSTPLFPQLKAFMILHY